MTTVTAIPAASEMAAYMPWGTFLNMLDALAAQMPNRIDKSVFVGQSGGMKSQLINGFRFLGLIDDAGKPQPSLLAIAVKDELARKNGLRKLIEAKYAPLFALNLMKTTPKEFTETMQASYKNTGDSARKAMRFFLAAIEYLGIDVTPLLAKAAPRVAPGNGSAQRRRRSPARSRRQDEDDEGEEDESPDNAADLSTGTSRSIQLKSGGTLTLSASLDLFSLNPNDRTFVFSLIDKLDEYEKANPSDADEDADDE
jgi:hypothetical protein